MSVGSLVLAVLVVGVALVLAIRGLRTIRQLLGLGRTIHEEGPEAAERELKGMVDEG